VNDEIGKNQVEIGMDENGLYFEAGSEDAAFMFLFQLLARGL